jgi:hypothetical protein
MVLSKFYEFNDALPLIQGESDSGGVEQRFVNRRGKAGAYIDLFLQGFQKTNRI